jgi:hypothetical protein
MIYKSSSLKSQWIHWLLIFTVISSYCGAQKEDNNWISGYVTGVYPDVGVNKRFAISTLNFDSTPPQYTRRRDKIIGMGNMNTSMSDSNGKLLFFSNGFQIYNKNYDPMEGGDTINFGYLGYVMDPPLRKLGGGTNQGIMSFKDEYNPNQYLVIYDNIDTFWSFGYAFYMKNLLYARIDMSYNNGLGRVLYRDSLIYSDTFDHCFTASRHCNGKDWWLLIRKAYSNSTVKILIDSTGPHFHNTQYEGPFYLQSFNGVNFSPDGNFYIHCSSDYDTVYNGVRIYHFNRSTGKMYLREAFKLKEVIDSSWFTIFPIVSPNSRYLYINNGFWTHQYDLHAQCIECSDIVVSISDGWNDPDIGNATDKFNSQLGPDGKIYIASFNVSQYLHVIDSPDLPDERCSIRLRGQKLASFTMGIPHFPNFKLGSTICDINDVSIDNTEPIKYEMNLYPNPSNSLVTINSKEFYFDQYMIYDAVGKIVQKKLTTEKTNNLSIDISDLCKGVYTLKIQNKDKESIGKKLLVDWY